MGAVVVADMNGSQVDKVSPAFFRILPQEIRDKIYGHAFGSELDISRIIWAREWREREMERRNKTRQDHEWDRMMGRATVPLDSDGTYKIRPFPGNPLRPMIISKKFFHEAACAWFHRASLDFETSWAMDEFIQKQNRTPLSGIRTISATWHRSDRTFSPNLKWCTGLRDLNVTIMEGLENIHDKTDFVDDLEASDFRALPFLKEIGVVSSITNLDFVAGEHKYARTAEEIAQYSKNLVAMRDFIMTEKTPEGEEQDIESNLDRYPITLGVDELYQRKRNAWFEGDLPSGQTPAQLVWWTKRQVALEAKKHKSSEAPSRKRGNPNRRTAPRRNTPNVATMNSSAEPAAAQSPTSTDRCKLEAVSILDNTNQGNSVEIGRHMESHQNFEGGLRSRDLFWQSMSPMCWIVVIAIVVSFVNSTLALYLALQR